MENKPTEQQIPHAEATNDQEELLAKLSDEARSLFEMHGGDFVAQDDGSQVRELRGPGPGNPAVLMVAERKMEDDGKSEFTYGATRLENPSNMQLIRWTEGGNFAERGVRSNVWKGEDQMHGTVELNTDKVLTLSFNMKGISDELQRKKEQDANQPRAGKLRRALGRLSSGGSR